MQYPHPHDPYGFPPHGGFPPQPPISGPPPPSPPRHGPIRRFFITAGVIATIIGGGFVILTIMFPDVMLPVIGSAMYVLGSRILFGKISFPGDGP